MQRNGLQWLRRDAPKYLNWAYEWMLEADLGDDQRLREGPSASGWSRQLRTAIRVNKCWTYFHGVFGARCTAKTCRER